ncbi:MAG: phosphoribosyl-AMP cyclohydrolase [Clostridiaceae bacterium]|nr:phosphoribosyl-AMP cyclohydrolase [Clostridiaceae bacterium]
MNFADLKFNDQGLIPAIAQDVNTKEVLMLAWMNPESIESTLKTGKATYWSRSRNKLWIKGESSGNYQRIRNILYDCDGDTLLLLVEQTGAACHTGSRTCFYREIPIEGGKENGR